MIRFDQTWEKRNRTPMLLAAAGMLVLVALIDWFTKPFVSLGLLHLFPIMVAAGFLPRQIIAFLALACAVLAELFSSLPRSYPRLALETLALAGCGLFVAEVTRNRRLTTESQNRMNVLIETSPAAIVTTDYQGRIELANEAAIRLLSPTGGDLRGLAIGEFLPSLQYALRWEKAPQFRTSMQCQGQRGNGETFTADIWFSTYKEGVEPKLAAIVSDVAAVTEDNLSEAEIVLLRTPDGDGGESIVFSARESKVLRLIVEGLTNREIASRISISDSAVKNTLQQLFRKTGVRTRGQLVRVALERYRQII